MSSTLSITRRMSDARDALKAVGVTIRVTDGELRVAVKGRPESEAYYTNDLDDAVQTGKLMAAKQTAGADYRDVLDLLRTAQFVAVRAMVQDGRFVLSDVHVLSSEVSRSQYAEAIAPLTRIIDSARELACAFDEDEAAADIVRALRKVETLARGAQTCAAAIVVKGGR